MVAVGPHCFDQAVVEFFIPLAAQEFADGVAALEDFGPVAPMAVFGVGQGNAIGVAAVPGVFGHAGFGDRSL